MSNTDNNTTSAKDISKLLRSGVKPKMEESVAAPVEDSNTETVVSNGATITFSRNRVVRKSRESRIKDNIQNLLEVYKTAKEGSDAKIKALADVVSAIRRQPTTSNLEMVYKFFVANKNETFLDPVHALQRQAVLDRDVNIKVRVFWRVMYSLAKGTATRRNTHLDTIRTIFSSDDFVNWVAFKLNALNRASKARK